jgi:enoyl-[acyl-carrier protein] reductase I
MTTPSPGASQRRSPIRAPSWPSPIRAEQIGKRVTPLAESVGSSIVEPCDVMDVASVDAVFDVIAKKWGKMDFLVHAIAFSNKDELKGHYANTTRENFTNTMVISCFAFTEACKRAAALMPDGGSCITLTYGGAERVMPNYNVMGVAKAALEASVRYLASDYGPQGVRVNAISAGPVRTLAGAGITDARFMYNYQRDHAPLRRSMTIEDVGGAGLYFLSDLSSGVTGEVHYVDGGYNTICMPRPEDLKG